MAAAERGRPYITAQFWASADQIVHASGHLITRYRGRARPSGGGDRRRTGTLGDIATDSHMFAYPGSPEGCRRLAAILDRPWAVLSAGVPFDQFTDVIRVAADEGGASGFIVGRSVWREVVGLTGPDREEFLATVALPRLDRLITVAESRARPWTEVRSPA